MGVKIYKGQIKEILDAVQKTDKDGVTRAVVGRIVLDSGDEIKNLTVIGGLDTEDFLTLRTTNRGELHVMHGLFKNYLVAVKLPSGKILATKPKRSLISMFVDASICTAIGIFTVPWFGIGLIFLFFAFKTWGKLLHSKMVQGYINSLPSPEVYQY